MFYIYVSSVELNDTRIPEQDKLPIMVYDDEHDTIHLARRVTITSPSVMCYEPKQIGDNLVRIYVKAEGVKLVGEGPIRQMR